MESPQSPLSPKRHSGAHFTCRRFCDRPTSAKRGGSSSGTLLRDSDYTPNLRNQYGDRTVPGYLDIMGLATEGSAVTVTVGASGSTAERQGDYFRSEGTVSNNGAAQYPSIQVQVAGGTTQSGHLFVPATPEAFSPDADGNLKGDGRWTYTWEAENRLTKMESLGSPPAGSARRLEFKYDWRGRRIYKKETNLSVF